MGFNNFILFKNIRCNSTSVYYVLVFSFSEFPLQLILYPNLNSNIDHCMYKFDKANNLWKLQWLRGPEAGQQFIDITRKWKAKDYNTVSPRCVRS